MPPIELPTGAANAHRSVHARHWRCLASVSCGEIGSVHSPSCDQYECTVENACANGCCIAIRSHGLSRPAVRPGVGSTAFAAACTRSSRQDQDCIVARGIEAAFMARCRTTSWPPRLARRRYWEHVDTSAMRVGPLWLRTTFVNWAHGRTGDDDRPCGSTLVAFRHEGLMTSRQYHPWSGTFSRQR